VPLPEGRAWDGGAADRIGWQAWRAWRPQANGLIHRVERSSGAPTPLPNDLPVVHTPPSGASLLTLRDLPARRRAAAALVNEQLDALGL